MFWVGHAPGLFLGYQTDGIVHEEDLPANGGSYNVTQDLSTGGAPQAGDIKIIDQNGDGVINTDDRVIIGNPNPDFTYGFQTRFTWRGLSLSAQFNGVHGKDMINTNIRYQAIPNRTGGNLRTGGLGRRLDCRKPFERLSESKLYIAYTGCNWIVM